jgi:hypothetical protein
MQIGVYLCRLNHSYTQETLGVQALAAWDIPTCCEWHWDVPTNIMEMI